MFTIEKEDGRDKPSTYNCKIYTFLVENLTVRLKKAVGGGFMGGHFLLEKIMARLK